jgi:hypothetical protein
VTLLRRITAEVAFLTHASIVANQAKEHLTRKVTRRTPHRVSCPLALAPTMGVSV